MGPAMAPTTTKRIRETAPAAAAEGVNPPIAKEARRFINKMEYQESIQTYCCMVGDLS
ncbi:hypothetical protein EV06_0867 [Prochlorococcus sp. MIT 0602]|nr:hypothetical protein EV06_0867 [Prochlorococcus sp. MIT 0602]KGG17277.1 hypothetical protein EV07_0715 [Prochlorococcus sp. MIT 0603]